MRPWSLLIVALTACHLGAPTAADDALTMPQPGDDPGEILSDVQHLIGEAVADHDAGERVAAEQQWILATAVFREHLLAPIRAADPLASLHLEYDLGRLGDAVRRNGGRPSVQLKVLNRALEVQRPVILAWYAERAREAQQP